MKRVLTNISNLINLTKDIMSENPKNSMMRFVLDDLETLQHEFTKKQFDRKKISQIHYGLLRVFEEIREFENTPFGTELGNLFLMLNELDKEH